jgi:hypothetical protein
MSEEQAPAPRHPPLTRHTEHERGSLSPREHCPTINPTKQKEAHEPENTP